MKMRRITQEELDEIRKRGLTHEMSHLLLSYEMLAERFVDETKNLFELKPIDMILHCPDCREQHIDRSTPDICQDCGAEEGEHPKDGHDEGVGGCLTFVAWLNPTHKSHRCGKCNTVWRPSEFPTNGVEQINRGSSDTWPDRRKHAN
jgi:hypothetical protein